MSRHIKSCHRQSRECVRPRKLQSQKCQKKVKDRDPTLSVTCTQNWTSSKKPERDGAIEHGVPGRISVPPHHLKVIQQQTPTVKNVAKWNLDLEKDFVQSE